MNTIDLTELILAAIRILAGIAMRYLIPYLREKLDDTKLDALLRIIDVGVYAAQQMFGSEKGAEKKAHVQKLLLENGYNIELPEVDAAIEAAVKKMKIAIKE